MCLQKAPELVACVSAHLASRWPRIQVEPGAFGFPWYCDGDPLLSENFNDLTKDIGETILKAAKYVDSPVLNRVLPTVRRPPTTISLSMDNRWFFSKQDVIDSPNMRLFADPDQEVIFKLRVTTLVQEMREKLQISTHTICIAMVFVYRFFMHFTFEDVDATKIAMVAVHLAGKTHNEPRKLEYFLKTAYSVVSTDGIQIDVKSEDWDRIKGCCMPEENNYFASAKHRFRAALRKHPNIKKLENKESHSRDYQFINKSGINTEDKENERPSSATPSPEEIEEKEFYTNLEEEITGLESVMPPVLGNHELTKKTYFLCTASIMATTMCLQYKP